MKVRNCKLHSTGYGDFYLINVTSSDNVGVTSTKYAKGSHDASYFASNG